MDRMKIVFNDVPLFLAKKIKELVVRNNFNCKIDGNVYEIKGEFGPNQKHYQKLTIWRYIT